MCVCGKDFVSGKNVYVCGIGACAQATEMYACVLQRRVCVRAAETCVCVGMRQNVYVCARDMCVGMRQNVYVCGRDVCVCDKDVCACVYVYVAEMCVCAANVHVCGKDV